MPTASVAQPGFTGIPQVDQIHQVSTAPSTVPQKNFPDPSEFLVSLAPASNTTDSVLQPNLSTPQPPLPQPPISAPVSIEQPYQSTVPPTFDPTAIEQLHLNNSFNAPPPVSNVQQFSIPESSNFLINFY